MAIVAHASGTLTPAVIGTEDFLSSPNVAGRFQLYVDAVNMAALDVVELRAYKMVLTGGTARVLFVQRYSGAQAIDEAIKLSDIVPNELAETNAVRFSLTQVKGTARAFPWKVMNLDDNNVNVATITAAAITAAAFAAGAIDAAAIAANAIGASELAADAVTEIQSGLATAAALATVQADTDDIQARLPAALVSGRMDASVGAMAANVVTATAIATDAITAAKIAADAIGASELAADAVAEIADAVWDENVITEHTGANSAGKTLAERASQATLSAVSAVVISIETVTDALPNAGALTTIQSDLDNIQTRLPAALVAGRMDSDVGAMQANVIAAGTIAADAIGASELAADAVAEIADAVWDEVLAGHLTGGTTGKKLDDAAAAGTPPTAIEIADAVLSRPISNVEGAAAFRSLAGAVAKLVNRVRLSGGTLTVYKTNDTDTMGTQVATSDAAAVPVVEVDTA